MLHRRGFLGSLAGSLFLASRSARAEIPGAESASDVLAKAARDGQVRAATLCVMQRGDVIREHFGAGTSNESMFLLGSITKPICLTAVMTLFDREKFSLDDPVIRYLPAFAGEGRQQVTMRHLMTHTSGLPDQLANNAKLRAEHAGLDEFVAEATRTPLSFPAGSNYQYSSMGTLLATRVGEVLSGMAIDKLVAETVFKPLEMRRSVLGLGNYKLEDMIACQTEQAAPESGAGDPAAKNWDWNSPYWRGLGAPWGGGHSSAEDVAKFLAEFLWKHGRAVKPSTATLMTTNHNPTGLTPRGLGFAVGMGAGSPGCSELTFGHTGSTGTICWADPKQETVCVVLTSLPGRAMTPHPRQLAADRVAMAFGPA